MDKSEFEKLFARCKGALERFVYFKMPSKADSDDILQEVALAAFVNMNSVKNPDSFKPWILKIAANKCRDFYRKRAASAKISLDETPETLLLQSRSGIAVSETVRETLDELADKDKQILSMYYLENSTQEEIAQRLHIPLGTVKSRMHTAKRNFKERYPYPPNPKGEKMMKNLPLILPEYKIVKSELPPPAIKWEEMMGWFIVPKLGEEISWAMYDFPEKKRTEHVEMKVTGKASVHGIEGVEITAIEHEPVECEQTDGSKDVERHFVAQLTDTHCRILAESHVKGDVREYFTFLDTDDFIPNWGFGEDNCGNEINLRAKGNITRNGGNINCRGDKSVLDVTGRYTVTINGKEYDTICVMDIESYNNGVASEQYIDQNGRTVLWRRFNHDNWAFNRYKQKWSERLPDNETITINGELYVHWYDCITSYILITD